MDITSKVLEMLNNENITFVYRVQLDTYFIVVARILRFRSECIY